MSFDTEIKEVDATIKRGYLDLVVNSYRPLFNKVKERAIKHMNEESIPEIALSIDGLGKRLVLKSDGRFYDEKEKEVELREIPKKYQEHSDYEAGCADSRSHVTPSIHSAMRSAIGDFREKVKISLASMI